MKEIEERRAIATIVEQEQRRLFDAIDVLKGTAVDEVKQIKERVDTVVHTVDPRRVIREHPVAVLTAGFAFGVFLGWRTR